MTLAKQLDEIFAPNRSGLGGTGIISVTPTSIDASIARAVAEQCDIDQLAAQAGILAARVLADALEQRALRPSDYADMPEVVEMMNARLVQTLPKSDAFKKAFYDALRMRG